LLPWVSVHVFDPDLFKAVEVGNSISGGVRRHQASSA
jgi:hypothetical protein